MFVTSYSTVFESCEGISALRVANGGVKMYLQLLCRALGGRTGRSSKGWDIGVSCMHPTAAAARLFAPLKLPVHMPIIEFHQDEVCPLTNRLN
jgi:GMP synthase-like glutamine amidotransferase